MTVVGVGVQSGYFKIIVGSDIYKMKYILTNKMKYLPFRMYKIEVPYTPSTFEEMMNDELSRSKENYKGFFKKSESVFSGNARNGNFELYKYGYGNTAMTPLVNGKISKTSSDTQSSIIEMKIALKPFTKVFLIFWFSAVTIGFLISLISTLIKREFNIGIPISLAMFLFTYGFTILGFSEEMKAIKRFFNKKWDIKIE